MSQSQDLINFSSSTQNTDPNVLALFDPLASTTNKLSGTSQQLQQNFQRSTSEKGLVPASLTIAQSSQLLTSSVANELDQFDPCRPTQPSLSAADRSAIAQHTALNLKAPLVPDHKAQSTDDILSLNTSVSSDKDRVRMRTPPARPTRHPLQPGSPTAAAATDSLPPVPSRNAPAQSPDLKQVIQGTNYKSSTSSLPPPARPQQPPTVQPALARTTQIASSSGDDSSSSFASLSIHTSPAESAASAFSATLVDFGDSGQQKRSSEPSPGATPSSTDDPASAVGVRDSRFWCARALISG